jgi:hypothetical protein
MSGALIDSVNGSSPKYLSHRYIVLHKSDMDGLNVDPRHLLSKPLNNHPTCATVWPLVTAMFLLWVISTDRSIHTCTQNACAHALSHTYTHTHTYADSPSRAKEKEAEDFCLLGYDVLSSGKIDVSVQRNAFVFRVRVV